MALGSSRRRLPASELRKIHRSDIEQGIRDYIGGVPHRFGASTGYDLIYEGRALPPKAIIGLAGKYAIGRILEPEDFTGGESSTCFSVLRMEGYEVTPKPLSEFGFHVGGTYSRRAEIHARFKGQEQGGISTPTDWPYIFLFTGESGDTFGYSDHWNDDHSQFSIAGEGQIGDMEMKAGNRAILDHRKNGKELHLFRALGKGQPVEYMGQFEYLQHRMVRGKDKTATEREVILFDLVPRIPASPTANPTELDLATERLRGKRWSKPPRGQSRPARRSVINETVFERDPEVRAYVLDMAAGRCEACGEMGPFKDKNGRVFLEVHHVVQLANNGADTHENAVAICPNCHRHLHLGVNAAQIRQLLYERVKRLIR